MGVLRGRFNRLGRYLKNDRNGSKLGLDLSLDFLVYSSHKSGTQSMTATLRSSGFHATHMHSLKNMSLNAGEGAFRNFLDEFRIVNQRKLPIISVFRLPMDRHISSFFQWYGDRPIRIGESVSVKNTVIARSTPEELQQLFLDDFIANRNPSLNESLHEFCSELDVRAGEFTYDTVAGRGYFENGEARLVLLRYDHLLAEFPGRLEQALGCELVAKTANLGTDKWYKGIRSDFTASLRMPDEVIHDLHAEKRDLIDLFYPHQFDSILDENIRAFGA